MKTRCSNHYSILLYCCLRDENNEYESFPIEFPEILKKDHSMILSILAVNCRFPHTVRGLESALKSSNLANVACIRENVAVALDYG